VSTKRVVSWRIPEQGPFNRTPAISDAPVTRLELLDVALLGKRPESFLDLRGRHLFAPRQLDAYRFDAIAIPLAKQRSEHPMFDTLKSFSHAFSVSAYRFCLPCSRRQIHLPSQRRS
jgi:hypothetical protein